MSAADIRALGQPAPSAPVGCDVVVRRGGPHRRPASGEGIYLYDDRGRRLIDGPGGMWCVQIGHGRREMAAAIAEQAMRLSYNSPWGFANEPAARLARKLAELSPGDLNTVMFTTGGSTAVDTALRFTHFYNNRLRPARQEDRHLARALLPRLDLPLGQRLGQGAVRELVRPRAPAGPFPARRQPQPAARRA